MKPKTLPCLKCNAGYYNSHRIKILKSLASDCVRSDYQSSNSFFEKIKFVLSFKFRFILKAFADLK